METALIIELIRLVATLAEAKIKADITTAEERQKLVFAMRDGGDQCADAHQQLLKGKTDG